MSDYAINSKTSRRSMLKWTGALAAAGAVGIGLGLGGDLLLRPNNTTTETATKTNTQTATATQVQTATATATATQSVTQTATVTPPAQTITQQSTITQAPPQEVLLTGAHDTGPFMAHIVNGVWVKSTPIEPNLPLASNGYAVRNRVYSLDRINYPFKRVDFDPSGQRNPQNRGKSQYVRISWDDTYSMMANELQRVKSTYGPSALMFSVGGHQWAGSLHNKGAVNATGGVYGASGWVSRFAALYGGATQLEMESSLPGWDAGGAVIWGFSTTSTNNVADILQNTKVIIHWSTDSALKSYNTLRMGTYLAQFKQAGIKQILIDPYLNDTGSVYCDQWIPINPATDEALMAAIAYIWITANSYDSSYISTHTVGFDKFHDYVLGVSDGVPKTPAWASPITGISADVITALAQQWAANPTYVMCNNAGANRRDNGPNWVRMLVTLCAMQSFGRAGSGLGGVSYAATSTGYTSFGGVPAMSNPVKQLVRHGQFGASILKPPQSWTVAIANDGTIKTFTYPMTGMSEVHMIIFAGGSGRVMNQAPNTNESVAGVQSPKVEFAVTTSPWWEAACKFSDLVLPTKHVCERDDLIDWENYSVYVHALGNATPGSANDYDIYAELAKRLGFGDQFSQGLTLDQWIQKLYATKGLSMAFDQFKSVGYYKYQFPDQSPYVHTALANFRADPVKNPLKTPSGLLEIYSARVDAAIQSGVLDAARESAIPKYIPSTEGLGSPAAAKYPLFLMSPHSKFARHSQWRNGSWHRDEGQERINGYNILRINPVDAAARGIKTGDVVRIFNDRGQILCGAFLSERIKPSVIWTWEGGWYTPQQPGTVGSLDLGGNANVLISGRSGEPITPGIINHTLAQVEKWVGA